MELINWSEKYPHETALEIAIRQSTRCICGQMKQIGGKDCGCGMKPDWNQQP